MNMARSPICFIVAASFGTVACHVYVGDQPPQTATTTAAPASTTADPTIPSAPAQPRHVVSMPGVGPRTPDAQGQSASTSCLDMGAATPPDCRSVPAADATCVSPALPQQRCNAYKAYFDPKVAAAAVVCMTALTSKQVCDAAQLDGCAKGALGMACADSAVGQLCNVAATPCKSTASECTSLLSGLNDQGKQQIAQCIAQGCSAGLYGCIQALGSSASALR